MPVVRGIRVLNAISTGNTTPGCLDTLLSDGGRLADVTQVLSSPQYSCALAQSNTAAHTLVRSNNAMTALFANPIGSCIFYQTTNSRDDMLGSSCYYNYMMSFSTPEATNAFNHFGNTPCMINCAFASNTAFLATAVSSNSDITKMLTCNSCVSACFRGTACSIKEAVGTAGRAAFWLSDATALGCLTASGLSTALCTSGFTDTLNRDVACVMCTAAFQCCIFALSEPANTYTRLVCATNEIITKGACGENETSCNFARWSNTSFGICCMAKFLESGNTYFMDCFASFGSNRQRACLFCFCTTLTGSNPICPCGSLGSGLEQYGHRIIKSDVIGRGCYVENDPNAPHLYFPCGGFRQCPMTIANGSQLSNTEVEYLGRFIKCNYNVITHADCRFTMISPGFWNQSSAIACFRTCYTCSLDRTTANTSGLTLNCGLYYTTDNAATFNRLCVPLPACIFQQLCGNVCCQFTVRYALSTFACCNYVYTGWIITDCATNNGASGVCGPAYFKTGHSRMCLFANSQPNTASWTHFPDVPLPFYTVAFCDEYFAGVSPMRTDGYQTTLGIENQLCCQEAGQYAMMFSFGKVGGCVRISCDHFVRNTPAGLACFTPCTCCNACLSLPAATHCIYGRCYEDYFQGHGSGTLPYCLCQAPHVTCTDTCSILRHMINPTAASHTLIYKNPNNQADSKAFLVGWRSFAMLYGGTAGGSIATCTMLGARDQFHYYNCCTCRGQAEGTVGGCGYFRNTPGVNVWCYGSQANNTMQGTELDCTNALAIGGSACSWTNFTFANAKIIGCRLVLSGAYPPVMTMCACCASCDGTAGSSAVGTSEGAHIGGNFGCQNVLGQTGHTTVFNTDGVVGTIVCCFESMYHQTPNSRGYDSTICNQVFHCSYCSGRCFCCNSGVCQCMGHAGQRHHFAAAILSDEAGLKTVNFYGSSNSVYSVPAFPNMPPMIACRPNCAHADYQNTTCYVSPAPTGSNIVRSDKSIFCVIDIGDAFQLCHFGNAGCCCHASTAECDNRFFHQCNPGNANSIGIVVAHHLFGATGPHPGCFAAVYTPKNCSQDMTTFDETFNFCYLIAPHKDFCLEGPYCFNRACECFGPNCCLSVPCSPCCPACNIVLCCQTGVCGGTYSADHPVCNFTRANGFTAQHVCVNQIDTHYPCCQTPPRRCCAAFVGCCGIGNHFKVVANNNSTFQCAMLVCVHQACGSCIAGGAYTGCCFSDSRTCCRMIPYDRLMRTCNQAGPNCLWFDFISSGVPSWGACNSCNYRPCKSYWNAQYMMDIRVSCADTCFCCNCLCFAAQDHRKRSGFQLYSACNSTYFAVDSLCYEVMPATQTRGSGAPLNTQNSVHIAYFDLTPYRCSASGGGGFFANGNPSGTVSGCSCCLMFTKIDMFYNL